MSDATTAARYDRHAIVLHWLTVVVIAVVYACMELRGFAARGGFLRTTMYAAHVQLGTLVFLLTALRLALRLRSGAPAIAPVPAAWQRASAALVHWALYALLLAMPIIGWLILNAEGRAVTFLFVQWPTLIGPDRALGHRLEELHETIATIGYFIIGLHAAAALAHHYFWRDDTLRRMLPRRG